MPYRFEVRETPGNGIGRILDEELRESVVELRRTSPPDPEAVHSVRKRIKRIRALLRLIRPRLGRKLFRRENYWFRDCGRVLAGARDAQVVQETLAGFLERWSDVVRTERYEELRDRLAERYRALVASDPTFLDRAERLADSLESARQRVRALPALPPGFQAFGDGLELGYRRARTGLRSVRARPDPDRVHEWRKRLKQHEAHIEVLSATAPGLLWPHREALHEVQEALGRANDVVVLQTTVRDLPPPMEPRGWHRALDALAESDRRREVATAVWAAEPLFAERASALVERVGSYWRLWTDGSA